MKNIFIDQKKYSLFVRTHTEKLNVFEMIEFFNRSIGENNITLAKCYGYYIVEKAKVELDTVEAYNIMYSLYNHIKQHKDYA